MKIMKINQCIIALISELTAKIFVVTKWFIHFQEISLEFQYYLLRTKCSVVIRITFKRCALFCLFVDLRPTGEFFTQRGTSPLPVKGFNFWPMLVTHGHWAERVGYITCHIYCDTGYPFIMVISQDPWHLHLLSSAWQWSCHMF